jgi:diguanylate cyclase (GGDEF)-like protein
MENKNGKRGAVIAFFVVIALMISGMIAFNIRDARFAEKLKSLIDTIMSDTWLIASGLLLVLLVVGLLFFALRGFPQKETEKKEIDEETLKTKDPLTGLDNRTCAAKTIHYRIEDVKGLESALIMFDLESMKAVNETYGHDIGDRVIQGFANLLTEYFNENSYIARVGGDEFVVFLWDLETEDRLHSIIEDFFKMIIVKTVDNVQLRCYAGIARLTKETTTFTDLERRADTALNIAKRGAKQRFVFFKESFAKELQRSKRKNLEPFTAEDMTALMRKDSFDTRDAFIWTMENHNIDMLPELLMRNGEGFLMISDAETHEILEVRAGTKDEDAKLLELFIGKNFNELFANGASGDIMLTKESCPHNSFVVSKTHSGALDADFVFRSTLSFVDDRECFVHTFKRVETIDDMAEEYRAASACQNIVSACACPDVSPLDDPNEYFEKELNDICLFFGAEQGFILRMAADMSVTGYNIKDTAALEFNRDIAAYARNHWTGRLVGNPLIFLEITPELDIDRRMKDLFVRENVKNVCLLPLWDGKNLYGYICLKNITRNMGEVPILCTIGVMIKETMKVLYEKDNGRNRRYYDEMTGYLNFEGFKRQMGMINRRRNDVRLAICSFDVIRFKYINEVFGYDVGDIVLNNVADMFSRNLEEEEFMCRVSADKFCALLTYHDDHKLYERMRAFVEAVSEFFKLNYEGKFIVELAMGIYRLPSGAKESVDSMLNMAVIARKRAKQEIGTRVRFYDEELSNAAKREIKLETEMEEAIKNNEFRVYLQPQVHIGPDSESEATATYRAEALCRWIRNGKMYATPGEFIPLFEHDGRITKLDMYMIENVCNVIRRFREVEHINSCLAVNVSRATLLQPDFIDRFEALADEYGILPGELEMEFTEGTAATDFDMFNEVIDRLKKRGVCCAMDDFGSEYSSLSVLQNLSLDVLKLDKKFFETAVETGTRQDSIVRDTITMAKNLNMMTVAEGIEDDEQIEQLKRASCDYIQGFAYARPMPVPEYINWVKKRG